MRGIFATAALALLGMPAAAYAIDISVGDGTLAVDNATGIVNIAARGALIGQLDNGSVTIDDPDPRDGKAPVVWGCESKKNLTDTKLRCSGTDVRFRIIGGFFRAKVTGVGMDLSLVGKGSVTLAPGAGGLTSGTYSLNGGPDTPFPSFLTTIQLGVQPSP